MSGHLAFWGVSISNKNVRKPLHCITPWIAMPMLFAAIMACSESPPMTPAETALRLLALHGLLGKSPAERSANDKNTLVDSNDLDEIFMDLATYDKFTGELYTGIILGAIATNQSQLQETRKEKTAQVVAGRITIHFDLVKNVWKINLNRTIPDELKTRAKREKARYNAAKAAGSAFSDSL